MTRSPHDVPGYAQRHALVRSKEVPTQPAEIIRTLNEHRTRITQANWVAYYAHAEWRRTVRATKQQDADQSIRKRAVESRKLARAEHRAYESFLRSIAVKAPATVRDRAQRDEWRRELEQARNLFERVLR